MLSAGEPLRTCKNYPSCLPGLGNFLENCRKFLHSTKRLWFFQEVEILTWKSAGKRVSHFCMSEPSIEKWFCFTNLLILNILWPSALQERADRDNYDILWSFLIKFTHFICDFGKFLALLYYKLIIIFLNFICEV